MLAKGGELDAGSSLLKDCLKASHPEGGRNANGTGELMGCWNTRHHGKEKKEVKQTKRQRRERVAVGNKTPVKYGQGPGDHLGQLQTANGQRGRAGR